MLIGSFTDLSAVFSYLSAVSAYLSAVFISLSTVFTSLSAISNENSNYIPINSDNALPAATLPNTAAFPNELPVI